MSELFLISIIVAVSIIPSRKRKQPRNTGIRDNRLAPCPRWPNSVSSFENDTRHQIKPFNYKGEMIDVMEKLVGIINSLPGSTIVRQYDNYLYATFTSQMFKFIDDTEFYAEDEKKIIHIRSASRRGVTDFGINRKRIEKIRKEFSD